MPIKTFWMMESNVGRVRAEEDLRSQRVSVMTQHPKSNEELSRTLAQEMGVVVVEEARRDEEGFARLKRISG